MAMIRANTRLPIDTEGDVYSLTACNDVGCQRLVDMMERVRPRRPRRARRAHLRPQPRGRAGRDRQAAEGHVVERHDHRRLRRADHARAPPRPSATRASTSTTPAPSRRRARGINVPLAYTTAYTVFGLGCIVAAPHPQQRRLAGAADGVGAGGLASSMRRSPRPSASATSSARCCPTWCSAACAQAIPDRVPAEGTSCLWNINVRGSVKGGHGGNYGFTMAITSNGGTGARPHADGLSATAYPSGVQGHAGGDRREPSRR